MTEKKSNQNLIDTHNKKSSAFFAHSAVYFFTTEILVFWGKIST